MPICSKVVWQDDVAQLRRQRQELDTVRRQLSEEGDLMQAENDTRIELNLIHNIYL